MTKFEADQAATITACHQKIKDLKGMDDQLTSDKKGLEGDKTLLTKRLDDANSTIADLNEHLQADDSNINDLKTQLAAQIAKPPPPQTDDLGDIQTPDGKTFTKCVLLRVDPDGIVIRHSNGIVKILYGWLSTDMQVRFGYNLLPDAAKVEQEVKENQQKMNGGGDQTPPPAPTDNGSGSTGAAGQ
ncbi:MAG TPA: hypothetical protein VGZ93_03085 [Candidatus Methylacidiphilales bacterium]|jgi:hypothetical protein|nr:hypothetical protein [Candidatus Methylacidiphilales bacterium]